MSPLFIQNIYEIIATDVCATAFPNYVNNLTKLRLQRMVEYAFRNSPFYRKKFKKSVENRIPFDHFPVCNKVEMMNHFDQFVTSQDVRLAEIKEFISLPTNIGKPFKNKYFIWESSGTNGHQGIYIQDRSCIARYQAIEAMRKPIDSICTQFTYQALGQERIAYIGVLDRHYASTVSLSILKADFQNLHKCIEDFSIFEPIEQLVLKLIDFNPSVIITYPSMAICLVDHLCNSIKPRELWLGGEYLSAKQYHHIKSKLKVNIYCSYGASEFLPIAWQCYYGNLHVNSDWVLLEPVDENYSQLPPGKLSHTTLLTNLVNTIQPIIRYDLGDQISYAQKKCQCGSIFPHIDLVGRVSNFLKFINLHGKEVKIPVLAIIALIEEHGIFNASMSQKSFTDMGSNKKLYFHFPQDHYPTMHHFNKIRISIEQYLAQNEINNIVIIRAKAVQKKTGDSGKNCIFQTLHPDSLI